MTIDDLMRRANPPETQAERRDDSLSFGDQQSLVYQALCVKLGDEAEDKSGDVDFWIKDLSDDWVVYHVYGGADVGDWKLNYALGDDDAVTFDGDAMAVVEQTTYIPAPEANAAPPAGGTRATPVAPGDVTDDPNAAPAAADLGGMSHDNCIAGGFVNVAGATACAQCGYTLSGVGDPAEDGADSQQNTDSGLTDPDSGVANLGDDGRSAAPKENLVRFRSSGPAAPAILLRDDTAPTSGQSGSTMFGYFSTFNDWYEIDSYWEGTFLERVAPGAYAKTIADDRSSMRVLYDHGFDPQIGNKPLGPIDVLREDSIGPYYEVPLLDTDYNRNFMLPALRGQLMNGQNVGSMLGASFRFIVTSDEWDYSGQVTSFNPLGLDLRTITGTQVMEFGPVTFPANDLASSGVRSACRSNTDALYARLRNDPMSLARFTERTSAKVVERILATPPSTTRRSASNTTQPTAGDTQAAAHRSFQLRARLALADS